MELQEIDEALGQAQEELGYLNAQDDYFIVMSNGDYQTFEELLNTSGVKPNAETLEHGYKILRLRGLPQLISKFSGILTEKGIEAQSFD